MTENNDKLRSKDTRWDRIRKRHMNSINIKTETVKKFIEMDFIGKHQMMVLNGDVCPQTKINPALVMDLRHEMIERMDKKKRDEIPEKMYILEKIKEHNNSVENHYIENELNKFKTELQRTKPKKVLRPKLCLNLNNQAIYNSLKRCNNHVTDFYNAPLEAMEQVDKSLESMVHISEEKVFFNGGDKEKLSEQKATSNDINKEETSIDDKKSNSIPQNRCVRFEDSVEIINYSREESECSNTSEDVESVISEFIEEVVHEIEIETQMEMIGHHIELCNNNCCEDDIILEERNNERNIQIVQHEEIRDNGLDILINEDFLKITKIQQEPHVKLIVEIHSEEESSSETESVSNEQDAIIAELFRPKFPQNEILLRKYFLRWIHFTTIEKIEKENFTCKNDRIRKINAFLDKVRREKNRVPTSKNKYTEKKDPPIVVAKKYQNKIKLQQDIIELQRLKLERQERMIMELKLSKLSEEARQAKQEIKNELRTVIRTGNTKNRTKAKCLQLVANLRDEEDEEFARLQGKALMMPKFLAKMQERALQRSIKHEQARQRRIQLEAEKEAAKIAAEEAKRLEDEEAKRQRIEALKEKRRQEKLAKIMKERERQRCIENNKKCEEFCRRRLLRRIGMEGFKRLLALKRKNHKKADNFRKTLLKKKTLSTWKQYYIKLWEHKNKQAADMYHKTVMRVAFRGWKIYISNERSKLLVAIDWYELRLTECCFHRWVGVTKLEKIIEETKMKQAQSHYHWHLKWKVLDRWQRLPQVLKLEKETEERRQRWRMKIWELLPDYTPNRDDHI